MQLDNEEWAYGTCDPDKNTLVEGVAYTHRPIPGMIDKTKAKMAEQQAKINPGKPTKPVSVVILTIDSLSRKQFFRKLPKTHAYINSLDD